MPRGGHDIPVSGTHLKGTQWLRRVDPTVGHLKGTPWSRRVWTPQKKKVPFIVGSTPFVTPQGTLQVGPTHRISSFPLSSFRLPRDSNPGPRVFSPMGSISGTN